MLIVCAIIVLLMAMAVPAFNALRGSRSVEGAANQVSAFLGQARAEALGVQEIRGVMFFLDPATDRVNLAMVRDSGYDNTTNPGVVYLDLVADRDFIALPVGVNLHTVDSAAGGSTRSDDGYIGYNLVGAFNTRFGGVILFDAAGRVAGVRYGFRCTTNAASASGNPLSRMGALLADGNLNNYDGSTGSGTDTLVPGNLVSQIGFAVMDRSNFRGAGYTDDDVQVVGGSYADEKPEEDWIDGNASLYLVNRYNGTLIKAE